MDSLTRLPLPRSRGIALLESVFAIAVFGLVAVSLVGALGELGLLAVDSKKEAHAMRQVQTLLQEQLRDPFIVPRERRAGPDALGVSYEVRVQPAGLENRDGVRLSQVYRIEAVARWQEGARTETIQADTLRYAQLYR